MNKLILMLLLCLWSRGSDAHKMGLHHFNSLQQRMPAPEALELFNPFLLFQN